MTCLLRPTLRTGCLFGLILAAAAARECHAAQVVGGPLPRESTWTADQGPYVVAQNVEVPEGCILRIEPGVIIRFEPFAFVVSGQLVARGTEAEPIVFTSARTDKSPRDWADLRFQKSTPPAALDADGRYQSGTILEHCVVEYGAGITVDRSAPLISHCTIRYNSKDRGGGILLWHSDAVVRNCRIVRNTTKGAGGGVRTVRGEPLLVGNHIAFNVATRRDGGGISSDFSAPRISRNTIVHNSAINGGGIATGESVMGEGTLSGHDHSKPVIVGNTISHNYATSSGGGIHVQGTPIIRDNLIVNNYLAYGMLGHRDDRDHSASTRRRQLGAGISIRGSFGGPAVIERNLIVHNVGARLGGGIHMVRASGRIAHNVILDNQARRAGGGVSAVLMSYGGTIGTLDHGNDVEITECQIRSNHGGGIEFAGGGRQTASVSRCNVAENSPMQLQNHSANQIPARDIWWGLTESGLLQAAIYDYFDNRKCGKVLPTMAPEPLELSELPELTDELRQFYAAAPQDLRGGLSLMMADDQGVPVGLKWAPPSVDGVAGYQVYFDQDTVYTKSPLASRGICALGESPIDTGPKAKVRIAGLKPGQTYSFVVTAYDYEGRESAYSNILTIRTPAK